MESMIDELLYNLMEMEKLDDLSTVHKLEREAVILKNEIKHLHSDISRTTLLLKHVTKLLMILIAIIEAFDARTSNAENRWKRYWGICTQSEDLIFEMESLTI